MMITSRTPDGENDMTTTQTNALDTLLEVWREHQDLRDSGASVAQLNESRLRLDSARVLANPAR